MPEADSGTFYGFSFGRSIYFRKQESVEELLGNQIERCPNPRCNLGRGLTIFKVKFADEFARQKKLARKQIHLDLAPLPASIVDNPINSDGRRFCRPCQIDVARRLIGNIVTKFDMAYFMSDEKCPLENRPNIFVQDETVFGNDGCAATVKHYRTRSGRLDIQSAPLSFGNGKFIRSPRIIALHNGLPVKVGCNLSR